MSNIETTTKDGVKIKVEGAGPELPSAAKAPSNKAMDKALSGAQKDLESQKPKLDSHGREIASSTQGLLDATQNLLAEKNSEERFQRLFEFSKGSAKGMQPSEGINQAARNLMGQASGMGSKISNNATDMFSWIRETMLNLATSSEFRTLAIEFLDLMQAMLGQLKTSVDQAPPDQPLGRKALKRTRAYDTEDDMNDEINEKLSILLRHVGSNPQYQKVVENFLKYSEDIYDRLYKVKSSSSSTVSDNGDLRRTMDEAWEILHDFSGRDSNLVPKLKKEVQSMLEKLRTDDELSAWTQEFRKLLIELMENPENSRKNSEKTRKMINRGQNLSYKYRRDLDKIYTHSRRVFQRIQDDPSIKQFQSQLEKLTRDITLNSQGQPDLFVMERSMSVIKDLLVERFRKALVDIPIKRVVVNSSALDLELSNITLEGTGMVPDYLHVELSSLSDFHFSKSADALQRFRVRIAVDHINPKFSNVKFDLEKKSFPSLKDHGIADLSFDGEGLSADVTVEFRLISNQISKAELTNCSAKIDKVNLNIEEQKHNILGALLTPIIQGAIKTRMQTGVEQFIEGRVYQIINQLNDWFRTKPFETMMKRGNESLQTASSKREEKKLEKENLKQKAHNEKEKLKDDHHHHHHSSSTTKDSHHSKDHKDSHHDSHHTVKKEHSKELAKKDKRNSAKQEKIHSEVKTTLDKEKKKEGADHHVTHETEVQAFNQEKFTKILKDDDPLNLKHQQILKEVKQGDHDLQHVKTHDKSKPTVHGEEIGTKTKSKELIAKDKSLKEGVKDAAPHLKPVETDDKSKPKIQKKEDPLNLNHKDLMQEVKHADVDLNHVDTKDKSKPMVHDGQQQVFTTPSS